MSNMLKVCILIVSFSAIVKCEGETPVAPTKMLTSYYHTTNRKVCVPFIVLDDGDYLITSEWASYPLGKNYVSQRCKTPTIAPQKLERIIGQCQEEIKTLLLQEALDVIGIENQDVSLNTPQRTKRQTNKEQVQSFTNEERRVAGCLLQCVYKKVKAVDETGFPLTEGLVRLYSEGVQDRNYYYAAFTAVQQCIGIAEAVKQQQPNKKFDGGQICDLAYEMFDCVSDKIDQFCGLTTERS